MLKKVYQLVRFNNIAYWNQKNIESAEHGLKKKGIQIHDTYIFNHTQLTSNL